MSGTHNRPKGGMRVFLSYFKPHMDLFILDMSCALAVALIDLAFPFASRWLMNELIPQKAWLTFWLVIGVIVISYVIRALLTYIINYKGHTFGIRVEADIRRDLFAHLQTLGFDYYDGNRVGVIMSRLTTDLFDITELSHHGPEDLFISLTTIIGSLIVMFTIQWRLALVIALMIPILILVVQRCRTSMNAASVNVKKTLAHVNADIESGISGFKTARAFGNEDVELKKFDRANDLFKTSKRIFHMAMGRFNATMEFFVSILSVAVIAAGGALVMRDMLTPVDIVTFSLYITTFVNPIRKLAHFSELFADGWAGFGRFLDIMATEPTLKDSPNAADLENVSGEIDISHVSFSYHNDMDVLHDVNLRVLPGETVAFVGSSGGGKTTLSRLIPRFYDVTGGFIKIDGRDVRSVTQKSIHKNVGVVQQDVFLFADTIAENIRYGKIDATMDEIISAAKKAEIYDDIMDMPNGFDTYVGERGVLLSGGQIQRISIARIFLKNPPILILDEATSALDSVTESKIQRTFETLSRGRTTIVIAHRLSTVRNADRIAVIESGRISEIGSHDRLIEENGAYARLVRAQM